MVNNRPGCAFGRVAAGQLLSLLRSTSHRQPCAFWYYACLTGIQAERGPESGICRPQAALFKKIEAMEGSIVKDLKFSILALLAVMTIAGCGGSSSAPAQEKGTLAVVITDGPTDDFDRILITLERMLLIGGDGGHQIVYDGPSITFDLLDLRDRADFAFSGEIIADDYSKIRLVVSDVQLIDTDLPGSQPLVDLPANGKIDLNPQGPFTIAAGQTTVVELDMDANRSFHVVEQGNGDYRLRPVIFVNVYADDIILPSKLVRVFGTVDSVDDTGPERSVLLCSLHFAAQLGAPVVTSDPTKCVRVFENASTSFFGEDGLASNFGAVAAQDMLTGIGFLTAGAPDVLFDLDAVVMEIGEHQPPSATGWETLRGLVGPDADCGIIPDAADSFCFLPVDAITPVKTQLQPTTRVLDSQGTILSHADVQDTEAGILDALRINNGDEEFLAALVVLSQNSGDEVIAGLLADVVPGDPYDFLLIDGMAVCVDEETDILRILVDEDVVTIVDLIDPDVLEPGVDMVEAAGTPGEVGSSCDIVADVVIVE